MGGNVTAGIETATAGTRPRARFKHTFVANLSMGSRLDALLVSAVLALLSLRLYLYLSGFPQVGGKGFHIAHMLWGGLLMIVALVILLAFIDRTAQWTGAILGGAGFGIFIDELGKFITRDINYFYRPVVAIIYLIFIALYLATREIMDHQHVTPETSLANALEIAKSLVTHSASPADLRRMEHCLAQVDSTNPLAQALKAEIEQIRSAPRSEPIDSLVIRLRWQYRCLLQQPWLPVTVVSACTLAVGISFLVAITETTLQTGSKVTTLIQHGHPSVAGGVLFASCAVVCAIVGLLALPRSRRTGYRWLRLAVLVSILLTQVFMFYYIQFAALIILAGDVLVLVPLTSLQNHARLERH